MKTILYKIAAFSFLFICSCQPEAVSGWATDQWDSGVVLTQCTDTRYVVCGLFPTTTSGGSINDVQYNISSLTLGATLSIPFEVVTTGIVGYQATPNGITTAQPPFRVTLMLDHKNDNSTIAQYRWYCTGPSTGTYLLGSADNTPQVLSCPLKPYTVDGEAIWTDVNGKADLTGGFEDTLANLGSINIVAGGNAGLAHGLQVTGNAVAEIGTPSIQ